MGENRIIEIKDKRDTKGCPDLFCDLIMKKPNTMATVSGKSHRKVSVTGFSLEEAKETHFQLGALLEDYSRSQNQTAPNEPKKKIEVQADRQTGMTETKPEVKESETKKDFSPVAEPEQKCILCGCTQNDCHQCIEKTGKACHWIAPNKCSACFADDGIPHSDKQ